MAKRPHTGEVTGQGTTGWTDAGGPFVVLTGRVTGPNDTGRPIRLKMTPQEARERAALLIDMAERIEIANGAKCAPSPEAEPENGMVDGARDMIRDAAQVLDELQGYGDLPISSGLIARVRALADEVGAIGEPEQPKSAFARMLAGRAPIDFTETRPGTWQTATPEDGARLDDAINSALAGLGTSLADLRGDAADETPTTCAECSRVRPRFSMDARNGGFVCSPRNRMHCGECGETFIHYTEDEHRHGEAEPGKLAEERSGMSWNDYLATLPEAQRQCEADPGHCEHDEHSTCCLCGYVTKECADPECDSTAYLNTDYCGSHQRP